jgi:hypothetical protein
MEKVKQCFYCGRSGKSGKRYPLSEAAVCRACNQAINALPIPRGKSWYSYFLPIPLLDLDLGSAANPHFKLDDII